jgi:uncharacterized protein
VAVYLLDTSALVKRYVAETGSTWVCELTDPAQENEIVVAKLCGPEAISAFVRKSPPVPNLSVVLADFRFDYRKQYHRAALTNAVNATAMRLAESHRLRGYDAVQLATAVELHREGVAAVLPPLTFVSADNALNAAAMKELLIVDDPHAHP